MLLKSKVSQALWGAGADETAASNRSPEMAHPPSTSGCFDRPLVRAGSGSTTPAPVGDKTIEATDIVAQCAVVKGLQDASDSQIEKQLGKDSTRVAELEAALVVERQRSDQKDKELVLMQQLLAKLEGSIEQQAKDAQLEQERISTLEKALAKQKPSDQGEKVEKLLLAVAGEKQKAEDRSKQLVTLQEQLREEEFRRKRSEEQALAKEEELLDLKRRLAEDEAARSGVERRLAEKEEKLQQLQLQLNDSVYGQRTALEQIQEEGGPASLELQERLSDEEARRKGAEDRVREREEKLDLLQRQIAEELTKREAVQGQLADKERQLADMQSQVSSDQDLERQRAVQGQVIEKEREVCDLQQQLADELSKRREVQYQNIERERLVHEKDRQVAELQAQLAAERATLSELRHVQPHGLPVFVGSTEDTPGLGFRRLTSDATQPPLKLEDEVREGLPSMDTPKVAVALGNLWQAATATPSMTSRGASGSFVAAPAVQQGGASVSAAAVTGGPTGCAIASQATAPPPTAGTGGSSMTFNVAPVSPAVVQGGQMRSRAYWIPGTPQWTTAAVSPSQQSAIHRRLTMGSRTFG